ncbi:unnamed protein product [Closterium sp. Naga37s-1]|nr:unnamed protein product [Closterium sp. Naga37s-1]
MFLQYKSSEPHRTPPKSVAKKHSRPYLTVHAFTSPPHPLPSTSPPLHIPSPPHPLPSTAPPLYIPSPPRPLPSTSPPLYIPSPPRPSHPRPLPSTSAPLHILSPLPALTACRDLCINQLTSMPSTISAFCEHLSMAHNQLQGPLPSALVSDNLWTL